MSVAMAKAKKRKKKLQPHRMFVYLLLVLGSLICLFPLYWLIRSSLMDIGSIFVFPPIWIPNPFEWGNYYEALTAVPFGRFFLNTLLIVGVNVPGAILASSICAYSFARLRWPGKNLFFMLVISSMMVPGAITILPTFIGWKELGFTNSMVPLTVPIWFGGGAFNVFLLRQFFMSIPRELDEAAFVDGASYFRIYWQVILPLARSALIVVGLFTFLNCWNDFMGPVIYLNEESKYTLSLGLQLFKGMYNAQWHLMMAATAVVLLPAMVVFFIGQNYFIEGIATTGIKG
jgi:multiple sugar transport system permease protein